MEERDDMKLFKIGCRVCGQEWLVHDTYGDPSIYTVDRCVSYIYYGLRSRTHSFHRKFGAPGEYKIEGTKRVFYYDSSTG